SNGNLIGITITSPGTGYTAVPTFTLVGGGIGNTGAITGSAALVNNVSGGLTKLGAGTLPLQTANNTSNRSTQTGGGTLQLSVANAITSSSKLDMAGGKVTTNFVNQVLPSTQLKTSAGGSIIDASGTVYQFANSATAHWTNSATPTLTIQNITGNKVQ